MLHEEKLPSEKEVPPVLPELTAAEAEMRELVDMRAHSEASPKHPERNEDTSFADEDNGIAGVFDGMGGVKGGQMAGTLAAGAVLEKFKAMPKDASVNLWQEQMSDILKNASEEINSAAENNPSTYKGMGTTATIVKIIEGTDNEKTAVIGNVGDSRAYLLRDRKLIRLTKDQSLVQKFIDDGYIKDDEDTSKTIIYEGEAVTVGEIRNLISHALGGGLPEKDLETEVRTVELQTGDILLLSSDGIHDNLTDGEIKKILTGVEVSPTDGSNYPFERQLVDKAAKIEADKSNPRSKADDKTAIIIKI